MINILESKKLITWTCKMFSSSQVSQVVGWNWNLFARLVERFMKRCPSFSQRKYLSWRSTLFWRDTVSWILWHLTLYLSTMTVLMRLVCLLSWWHCCLKQFLACGSNSISWKRTCHIHWCNLVTENSIPLVFILPRIYHRDHFSSDTSEESMCLTFLILVGWQVRVLFMAETYKDTLFYVSGESFLSCGRLKLFFFLLWEWECTFTFSTTHKP